MEIKIGTKCVLKHLTSKDSDEGVLGKIISYASDLGGRVNFSTPHGTIIETGILWLRLLNAKEKTKLKELELDAIEKNGCLYGKLSRNFRKKSRKKVKK